MNKNFPNKVVNFLKKEGFYVILFVCLCIVAVVAAVTVKDSKHSNTSSVQQSNVAQNNNLSKKTAKSQEKSSMGYDNALQVKKSANSQSQSKSSKSNSQSVSKTVRTSFEKPVNGTLARGYSGDPVYWDSTASYRPNLGYDLKCDLGTPVMAAMNGKVEEVNTSTQDGVEVIIDHQNGLKTVYSNLDPKVKVSKGQTVTAGTVIGSVGKTTLRSAYEKYGDHLHFAVLNGNNFVDPGKYIKY
ncbi:M23 family metallopeptidase [Clostridium fermenticellae]|uniref:M23 family metallopeptidase n=1 Tax=Clostridium fermenticellae TaxID=2068654 RepID=A0A386H0P0_9CLOT|nr:M23 family metallopeptidase [Clostridium fermenticellae]AYD39208.1 M23 family metallopeptidase [Clostridium fermenticellae]